MRTPNEGLEFAKWMRTEHPEVRVILISGFYEADGIEEYEVMRKPFSRSDLVQALRIE